jgi:hypothetical protein
MPIQRDETHSAHAGLPKFFKLAEKKVMLESSNDTTPRKSPIRR